MQAVVPCSCMFCAAVHSIHLYFYFIYFLSCVTCWVSTASHTLSKQDVTNVKLVQYSTSMNKTKSKPPTLHGEHSAASPAAVPASPLLLAAQRGDEVAVRALLRESSGAGLNDRSGPKLETALECSIVEGHLGCVKVMVSEFHADTNTQGMNIFVLSTTCRCLWLVSITQGSILRT